MTTAVATTAQQLLTAEEFVRRHSGDYVELIDGVVQELPVPHQKHGMISWRTASAISSFVDAHDLGRVSINDSFVQTKADRVRGADVSSAMSACLKEKCRTGCCRLLQI